MSDFDSDAVMAELGAALAERWKARSPAERRAYSAFEAPGTGAPTPGAAEAPHEADTGWWQHREPSVVAFQPTSFSEDLPLPEMSEVAAMDRRSLGATPPGAPGRPAFADPAALQAELERTERLMALSGAVNPAQLTASGAGLLDRDVLDRLAPRCDRTLVDSSGNTWSWVLKAETREQILKGLDPGSLRTILSEVRGLSTDPPGRLLRDYAAGQIPVPAAVEGMALTALQTTVQALAWAHPLDSAIGPVLAAARREAAIGEMIAGYDRLLADGFFGRKPEVERIRSFITALPRTPAAGEPIPVLGVSGIGGSGKSTLLAYALRQLVATAARDPESPIVINIDFDRLRFIEGGELEWSFEFTRQVALFVPDSADALGEARSAARHARDLRGEERKHGSEHVESLVRDSMSFEDTVGTLLRPAELWTRKIVIVLDTFEEWQREAWDAWTAGMPALRLLEWVMTLSRALGVTPGLIVSGRAPVKNPGFRAAKPVDLEDLPNAQASALLRSFGVTAGAAQRLAKSVGGNPLALKLAARYYVALPKEARAGFASDSSGDLAGLDVALRQGQLYRRFLQHIPDQTVRQLAHPGLAVRRVTAEIIQEVLAVPCGLGTISREEAQGLLARLEREAWLVEREGETLIHRPDVRRSMLRLMATDPVEGPRVRAVHEAAVGWFDRHPGPEGELDGAYHRLCLAEPNSVDWTQFPTSLLLRLVPLAGDFPDAMRALLRDAAGAPLSTDDAAHLPDDRRRAWAERRAADLVQRGQPRGALRFWRTSGQTARDAPWLLQATFQAPDWTAPYTISELTLREERLSFALLLAFVRDDQAVLSKIMEVLWLQSRMRRSEFNGSYRDQPSYMRSDTYVEFARPPPDILLENLFFTAVINFQRRRIPNDVIPRGTEDLDPNALGLSATAIRRIALVSPTHPVLGRYDVRRFLAQCFRPDPSWLRPFRDPLSSSGADLAAFDAFVQRVESATRFGAEDRMVAPPSADLLGSWASDFAETVIACMATPPTTATMIPIVGLRGDDPEWRVPIREVLARAFKAPADFARFAARFDGILPRDLVPAELVVRHARAPRAMWMQLVEYFDRIGALRRICGVAAEEAVAAVEPIAIAYQRWDDACTDCISRENRG